MRDRDEVRARVRGLFNITVTPFGAEGDMLLDALAEAIERAIGFGYDGILIGGTYGEFAVQTVEERALLFRRAMEVVGDRVPVLLCTAHSDQRVVEELTELAAGLGGLAMVTPPYVSEVTDGHVVEFFRRLTRHSPLGVMIYNAPGVGPTLPPALLEQLADLDGIVALKQGDLSPTVVDRIAANLVGRIRVLAASDLAMLAPLAAGFDGLSSTNSCALPELIREIYDGMADGDARRAGQLHRGWYPYRALAREFGQPQTVKAAMQLRGWRGGSVRRPLPDLTAAERERLAAVMQSMPEGMSGLPASGRASQPVRTLPD
ncbi:MAG: dihydrodipicolinate synthase family protein [Rhizobiales bacterium]|nr:dihydrodipicolinate synthase family protein [Hyphomicrobiales bacterium]